MNGQIVKRCATSGLTPHSGLALARKRNLMRAQLFLQDVDIGSYAQGQASRQAVSNGASAAEPLTPVKTAARAEAGDSPGRSVASAESMVSYALREL